MHSVYIMLLKPRTYAYNSCVPIRVVIIRAACSDHGMLHVVCPYIYRLNSCGVQIYLQAGVQLIAGYERIYIYHVQYHVSSQ
jgi:hypothetical protein